MFSFINLAACCVQRKYLVRLTVKEGDIAEHLPENLALDPELEPEPEEEEDDFELTDEERAELEEWGLELTEEELAELAELEQLEAEGSRVDFVKKDLIINLHKPHPAKEVKAYALKQLKEQLKQWGEL